MKLKLAVIGAGSTYSPEIFEGIINRKETLPFTEIALMDIDERKLSICGSLVKRMLTAAGLEHIHCFTTTCLDTALTNSDYVIAQIRVGKLDARILDEKIPLKYNLIGQETTGIGGFFNALRTIPEILKIAKKMEQLCPDAWLINFSNPSGIVAQAVLNHSSIKMVGLCNCPINTLNDCRKMLQDPRAEIEYMGLNHLTWVTKVISNGEDKLQSLLNNGMMETAKNIPDVGFDLEMIKIAGGIPSSYLNYYYLRNKQLAHLKESELCRGEECKLIEEKLLQLYQDESIQTKPALLNERGGALYSEAAVSLIESIHNDFGDTHVVDLKNKGAIPFLDDNDVIEISALVHKNSITPIPITAQPNQQIVTLIQTVKAYERLSVEAALYGDRTAALLALMIHPLIGDFDAAKECFSEMLYAHKEYLPQFF